VARLPEHQFLFFLVELFRKPPDDPFYEHINPYLKIWLYECWIHKQEVEIKRMRDHALFIGSFSNPEAANKYYKLENPDFKSTDEEETAKMVRKQILEEEKQKSGKGRKRRKLVR
jgi:hypothetical protein